MLDVDVEREGGLVLAALVVGDDDRVDAGVRHAALHHVKSELGLPARGQPRLHGDLPQLLPVLHPGRRLGRRVQLARERRRAVLVDGRRPREGLELRPLGIFSRHLFRLEFYTVV